MGLIGSNCCLVDGLKMRPTLLILEQQLVRTEVDQTLRAYLLYLTTASLSGAQREWCAFLLIDRSWPLSTIYLCGNFVGYQGYRVTSPGRLRSLRAPMAQGRRPDDLRGSIAQRAELPERYYSSWLARLLLARSRMAAKTIDPRIAIRSRR